MVDLGEVADELSRRLVILFLDDADGRRPAFGDTERLQTDPVWHDRLLFHEYLHGDTGAGLGASHQTGWTGLVAGIVSSARGRARSLVARGGAADHVDELLVLAADRFVVAGPTVVAGYPWFGAWSRDTAISYEGLLLETGRADEGRALLRGAASGLSDGMLPNTADTGELEYDTADGTLWFVHAVGRHVRGTRYGIGVDPADGLLRQGVGGVA